MESMGTKIRKLREARGMSQSALAAAARVSQPVIAELEAGNQLSSKKLPEIARALGVDVTQLDERYSGVYTAPPPLFAATGQKLPVYTAAEGGNGHLIIDFTPIDYLPRPQMFEDVSDAYAILVTGESMVPAYEPGDHALVHPRLPPIRGTDVILYEVDDGTGEARATIKRLVGWNDVEWTLQQWNPAHTFKLPRSDWNRCHRVVGKFSRR
jgi:transcriptional regulator with XRE-family HTH domain